jgi:hypothetical protein
MGLSSPTTTPFGAHSPPADAFLLPLFTVLRGIGILRSTRLQAPPPEWALAHRAGV